MPRTLRAFLASAILRAIGQRPHPPMAIDAAKAATFEAIAARTVDAGENVWIEDVPEPKYEFLQWLRTNRPVLFHGSARDDLDLLSTVRRSRDTTAFGDQQAIYASDDPIWAMYFAVLRRGGSITWTKNSCIRVVGGRRERMPLYAFGVNPGGLTDAFGPGVLYVLPKATFHSDEREFGVLDSCHWVSPTQVAPLARVRVQPEDFPFLDAVFETDKRGEIGFALAHRRSRRR